MNIDPPGPPVPHSTPPEDLDDDDFATHIEQVMAEARRRAASQEPAPEPPDRGSSCW